MSDLNKPFDLAVCCRIYPRVSGQPVFGFTDKLELVKVNLTCLKRALGGLKVKIWFLLDNCPPAYEELIRSLFVHEELVVVRLNGEGNWKTFCRQIEILSGQADSDLVYFAEDDYLYVANALEKTVKFMLENPSVDFATLYDHADYYRLYVHRQREPSIHLEGHAWRLVASTCLTFMARRAALQETAGVFRTFANGNSDLGLWLALTKRAVLNPWSILRSLKDGPFVSASHFLAWRHAGREVLFGKKRQLLAPQPSLASHMEITGIAPGVDWVREIPKN